MSDQKKADIFELYTQDPEKADEIVFGRIPDKGRRGFLKGAGLATMGTLLGASIPFHRNMPSGIIPAALAENAFQVHGKDGLTILNDRPVNAETPAHLLDDEITPTARHFIRNNGIVPTNLDPKEWKLRIDDQVDNPLELTIDDLRRDFEVVTLQLQIECGGNGRAFFEPKARGNQWTVGAVACAEWTGVRLRDVLKKANPKKSAIYTAHYGADIHLSGNPDKLPISRGVPMEKAMEKHNLIAFQVNGGPLHPMNGAPLRLVIPGWPGSLSHKWLKRVRIRDVIHDGPKMTGKAYRVPKHPMEPGAKIDPEDMVFIESMPVKSLITNPKSGIRVSAANPVLNVRGHAWAGDNEVKEMLVSIDFGATWIGADLAKPKNRYAWQGWKTRIRFPTAGYYEVWARATDDKGNMQPFAIAWNPKGYLNNSMHRISVIVA
uniref:Sulfoxide reductase catalytic subunit YedY n=1 Tax=Candidatus Kentrum sp. TUN TaxID=2126343 RepID=A0A451A2R9_9GAMM|nr:MAG: sulfoxide reductase catalytic subunit YedY [Candidatus Kentron sp. TUN]VFK69739.1 MAG: sulfoxide reductase catalytic subunit YedY [Candidatus Kentron sp. TUN]